MISAVFPESVWPLLLWAGLSVSSCSTVTDGERWWSASRPFRITALSLNIRISLINSTCHIRRSLRLRWLTVIDVGSGATSHGNCFECKWSLFLFLTNEHSNVCSLSVTDHRKVQRLNNPPLVIFLAKNLFHHTFILSRTCVRTSNVIKTFD